MSPDPPESHDNAPVSYSLPAAGSMLMVPMAQSTATCMNLHHDFAMYYSLPAASSMLMVVTVRKLLHTLTHIPSFRYRKAILLKVPC